MSESPPQTMKAFAHTTHGDPTLVLHSITVPLPTPSATQILLKVHAVALNPVGYKAILHFPSFMVKKPCIPESDVAGTIVAVGEGVTKWKVGQNVYGIVPANDVFSSGQGGLAEYTLVKEDHLYSKPDFLSWEEASSISLTALTAYQALIEEPKAHLLPNSTVFINGGSGGVGLFAIQIARHLVGEHGKVITTCSLKNTSLVKQHGATEALDYTSIKNLPEYLSKKYSSEKFDVILDCIGDFEMYNASPAFLQPKGDYVVIGAPIPKGAGNFIKMVGRIGAALLWPRVLGGTPRRLKISVMQATGEKMQRVGELVKGGKVKPVVDSVWEFDEEGVKGAYRKIMTGHARGKVVIKVLE